MSKILKKKKGFTLVELIIVLAIVAILIGVALPKFSKVNLSAQATSHNANVNQIVNASILYLNENPNIENNNISLKNLSNYFQNKIPKPAKALNIKEFTVSIDKDGKINVKPGLVKVKENKLVEKNE